MAFSSGTLGIALALAVQAGVASESSVSQLITTVATGEDGRHSLEREG